MSERLRTSMAQGRQAKKNAGRTSIVLPAGLDKDLIPIGKEALRIHEAAEFAAQTQFEQAKMWRTLNYWLGVPAAVTATLAGSAILGQSDSWSLIGLSGSVIGGILALVSAALSATLTTVNTSRRMTQAQSSANAYLQLQTEARQMITIDLTKLDFEQARASLEGITNSRNELNKTADVPSRRAYNKVKKNLLVDGGQDYIVDQET